MSATIIIPADLEQQMLKAKASGQPLEEFALNALRKALESPLASNGADDASWLDIEYMNACKLEADPSVTLESVRQILAKLPGSLAEDIIAERDKRF